MLKLKRPTLLVDKSKTLRNISAMAEKAGSNRVTLSPHFKTHQSREIAKWYSNAGVQSATVSSVTMARYFADDGWEDITIVFPVNPREVDDIDALASITNLTILIDSVDAVNMISEKITNSIKVLIEIDTGYHRTGMWFEDKPGIGEIINAVNSCRLLTFEGFYCHSGNTYKARSLEEIATIHTHTVDGLNFLKKYFGESGIKLSLGDTPACCTQTYFKGIDTIRPGNFVFYDLMQAQLGSCKEADIAIAMACPVVFKNSERLEIVVYGGGVHFSKENLMINGKCTFGKMIELMPDGWSESLPGCYLSSVSQEHGILRVTPEVFEKTHIGDMIGILPVHSCLTADLMGEYTTLDGHTLDHMSGAKFR